MLQLKTNTKRNFVFEIDVQGINTEDLEGFLTIGVDNVSYGFPVKISESEVVVDMPALDEIIKRGLKHEDIIEGKLEIYGNGFYLNPWSGEFQIEKPVKMEAKMRGEKTPSNTKSIKATLKETPVEKPVAKKDRDALLSGLFEKAERKTPKKKQSSRDELIERKIQDKISRMNSLVENALSGKRPSKPKTKTLPKMQPKEQPRQVIQEVSPVGNDPKALMESRGMKNPVIQEKMIERAIEMGGSGNEAIYKTLSRMLSTTPSQTPYQEYA